MSSLPDRQTVQAALTRTTRRLAAELLAPQAQAPAWNEFEWRTAMAVCAMQGISVLLARQLRWTGPEVWQAYLAEQQTQGTRREQRITALLHALDADARQTGVAMVALKGSALLSLGLHGTGERPMSDIDLLVREKDLPAATAIITKQGYAAGPPHWKNIEFLPAQPGPSPRLGEGADHPIGIDLHLRVRERMPLDETDITDGLWPIDPMPGLQAYRSTLALLRHLLLHTAGNMVVRSLRMIQLVDLARVTADWRPEDWAELLDGPDQDLPWWALPPLRLASSHLPLTLPAAQLRAFERRCPRPFSRATRGQHLEDVSFAQLGVRAFPGIAWCRTPAEAARWMAARLLPSRATLEARRTACFSQPALRATSWAAKSHGQRAWHWLVARPMRPQTVHVLQMAMAYRAAWTGASSSA